MKCKWKVAALIIGLVLCTSGMVNASQADALEEINGFQIQMAENEYFALPGPPIRN